MNKESFPRQEHSDGFDESGEIETEAPEPIKDKRFLFEDAEVTVRIGDKLEGGWVVENTAIEFDTSNPTNKQEHEFATVAKGQQRMKIEADELLRFQPFKVGEQVPVIRSSGKLEVEGWHVKDKKGEGYYEVEDPTRSGHNKVIHKIDLIKAQLASLEWERQGILEMQDRDHKVLDYEILENIKAKELYWKEKLRVAEPLKKPKQKK